MSENETEPTETKARKKSALEGAARVAAPYALSVMDPRIILVKDESHFLYNPRVHYPPSPEIGEALATGHQTKDIVVMKDGDERLLVVDGRQEVISGRAYVKKHGGDILVNVRIKRFKDNKEAVIFMNKADLHIPDDPITTAERMLISKRTLVTDLEVAKSFGLKSATTVENYLKLLDLDDEVKKAVRNGPDKGGIDTVAARRLVSLSRDEQRKTLSEMIAAGAVRGAAAQKAVTEARAGKKVTGKVEGKKMLTRAFVAALILELETSKIKGADLSLTLLKGILGDKKSVNSLPEKYKTAWTKALKSCR